MSRLGLRALAIAGTTLLALAGCSGGSEHWVATPAPGSGLPPRPATLRIQAIDPCRLLTPAQYQQLGVDPGHRKDYEPNRPLQGTGCIWSTTHSQQQVTYTAGLVTNRGAEFALGAEPLRTVDGYAATTTASALADPKWYCALLVDVAPGQSLLSNYSVDSEDIPSMTHVKACDNAQTAAGLMLDNLRAAQPTG